MCGGEERSIQDFGGEIEGKTALGRRRRGLEDNIKFDLKEIGWKVVDWIYVVQDRDR
jgi:hypothetical protein